MEVRNNPFGRQPPPNFRGMDPDLPITRYDRHLPHWRQQGASYFVTFNLADSIPKAKRRLLQQIKAEWQQKHPIPWSDQISLAYARIAFQKLESWMDAGSGACWFRQRRFADALMKSILHHQHVRHFTSAAVAMPNHCHLIMRPFEDWSLENILRDIKSVVARFINHCNGTRGSLWQQESYDRIIRDVDHLERVVQYIGRNPAAARLPRDLWFRWIHPSWQEAGWDFDLEENTT